MIPRGGTFELAPAGVLRGAAWPSECLDGFGDPELGRLAGAAWRTGRSAALERAYSTILARERDHLWDRTLGDPLFEKALAISSLSARARGLNALARRDGSRNRSLRIVEYTLFRYLARAAGRTSPHGLWAGVAEVGFGNLTRVDTLPPTCRFTPDLRPFQALIRGLAARPEYMYRTSWSLNPTLRPDPQGGWVFFARREIGGLERRALGFDRAVSLAVAILAELPPGPLDGLAAEIARRGSLPVGSRRRILRMLEALADGGALVGGMGLPTAFESPWDALERTGEKLRGSERTAWDATIQQLGEKCDPLSTEVWTLGAEAFVGRLSESRRIIRNLGMRLGLDADALPNQVLRCDLHLPWRLTLDASSGQSLLQALWDYDRCWLRGASPATGMRKTARERFSRLVGKGLLLGVATELLARERESSPYAWPRSRDVEDSGLRDRLQTWEHCLGAGSPDAVLAPAQEQEGIPASPVGCLFAGISDNMDLSVHSVTDQPSLAAGRFGGVLESDDINQWIRGRFRRWSRESGISLAELRAPFERNPNVLAGTSITSGAVAPWGADPDSRALVGARVRAQGHGGSLVLELPGDERPLAVFSRCAADLQSGDPVVRLLLWTGYQESPGRDQRAADVPVASELARPGHSPRVRLSGGALLRSRMTFLTSGLQDLKRKQGLERFCAWQELAREMGWGGRLQVSVAGGDPIPVHRDSPLGIEALFKGVKADTPYIAVGEADAENGLSIPGLGTHKAELALPFARVG